METENTEYIHGDGDDFTIFLFSEKPKEPNSIKLELDPSKKEIHIGLHIFQELLMIFTSGIKYLFSDQNEKVDITRLSIEDIQLMNEYFKSMGFTIDVSVYTIVEYMDNMKLPNYFLHQEEIKENTLLKDFYYETSLDGKIYRILFDFLR
tara:strand:- start:21 stop:470 length:450 start_codon:yes stop_codon:yes gene_type:complete